MKKLLVTLSYMLVVVCAIAQDMKNEIRNVVTEGKQIFKVEMANWISNDVFSSKYKGKEKSVGNISYIEADKTKSVFFGKGEKPKVLGTITLDEGFNEEDAIKDFTERDMTDAELDLFKLQTAALKEIQDAASFTTVPNTTLSVIPIIVNNEKKVFLLSKPTNEGTVIFGNDYLLSFDSKYKMTAKQALHKTLASITYNEADGSANDKKSSHTHVAEKGDMVTSTDIATLLLYQKPTHWSHHTFISENNIFFWNYASNELQVISKTGEKK